MTYPFTFLLAYQAEPRIIGFNYEKALRQLGYRVFTCDISSQWRAPDVLCDPNSDISEIIASLSPTPDVVMHFESRGFFPRGWEKVGIPRIWYSTEGDVHLKDHVHIVDFFDLLCSSNRAVAEYFRQQDYLSYFLPLAVDTDIHFPQDVPLAYDIAFVGTLNMLQYRERARLLRMLQEHFQVNIVTQASPEECACIYASAKLVFDKSLGHGINTRPFEALACRKLLLTAADPESGLSELLQHGEHLIYYQDDADLLAQVTTYLNNEQARETIARKGYDAVVAHHTYIQRVKQLVAWIQEHTSFGINLTRRQRQLYNDHDATCLRYAYLYAHNDMWQPAIAVLNEAQDSVSKWSLLAVVAFKEGKIEQSLHYFKRCIEADPTNPEWPFHCASLSYEKNEYADCRAWLEQVEQLWQDSPYRLYQLPNHASSLLGLHGLRGASWFHEQYYEASYHELSKALAIPESYHQNMHWHILNLLGMSCLKLGALEQAKPFVLASRQSNPTIEETHLILAELYCLSQDVAAAIDTLQQGRTLVERSARIDEFLAHLQQHGIDEQRPLRLGE